MTGAVQPKKLSQSIIERLQKYFDSHIRPNQIPEFDLKRLRRDIQRLRQSNRLAADERECELETLLFNYDRCLELIANIRANSWVNEAQAATFRLDANFAYATKASALIRGVFENPCNEEYHHLIEIAVAIGAFNEVVTAIELANKQGLVFKATKLVQIARQAQAVLANLGISDAQVASCIDVAGEILRENKLLWLESGPIVYVVPLSTGEGAVLMEFKVPVSAKEASAMSWLLTEKIVERGLDFPGLSIGFMGVAEPAEAAA